MSRSAARMSRSTTVALGGLTAGVMTPRYGLPCGADMTGWSCPRPLPLPPRQRGTAIRAWTTPRGTYSTTHGVSNAERGINVGLAAAQRPGQSLVTTNQPKIRVLIVDD